jgi:hypothetical protein
MKFTIKILPITFILITIIGCKKDLLNTIPNDRISTDIYWKTDKDAILAANAVYTYVENVRTFFMWDGISDIGHTNVTQNEEAYIELGTHSASDAPIRLQWSKNYNGIRAANNFLDNVDRVTTSNPTLIKRLKGEVRFLRSFYYHRLVSLYGDVPLIKTAITLEESRLLSRTPVAQVWDFINAELTAAAADLPTIQTDKGRITKGAALALKARSLLFSGKYSEAAIAAKQVMDLNVYSLYPSYKNLFSYAAENNQEVIFDVQHIKDIYSNNAFQQNAPFSQQNSNSAFIPTKRLTDVFQMTNGKAITDFTSGYDPLNPYVNRDPRLKYSIFVPGEILPNNAIYNSIPGSGTADAVGSTFNATQSGLNCKKYINKEDLSQPANCGINIIHIRYAEILLTYAEAKIESNSIDQSVLDAINLVRKRPDVNMPTLTTIGTQEQMRDIVRNERVVELSFEGLRYFDILRWKIAETVMPGKVFGLTYDDRGVAKTIEVTAFQKIFNKNRHYLWPIPQTEKDLNPNLGQNPGW